MVNLFEPGLLLTEMRLLPYQPTKVVRKRKAHEMTKDLADSDTELQKAFHKPKFKVSPQRRKTSIELEEFLKKPKPLVEENRKDLPIIPDEAE